MIDARPADRLPGARPARLQRRRAAADRAPPGATASRITAETCPHYLTFAAEEIPDGATQFKCCPPIREAANRERCGQGLRDGTIDWSSPTTRRRTADLKLDTGDFGAAWGGISSLQLGLLRRLDRGPRSAASPSPTSSAGCAEAPGAPGRPAPQGRDRGRARRRLRVLAPDEAFTVDAAALHHNNPVTPYAGRTLAGVVRSTWLRGAADRHRRGAAGPAPDPRSRMSQLLRRRPVACPARPS